MDKREKLIEKSNLFGLRQDKVELRNNDFNIY